MAEDEMRTIVAQLSDASRNGLEDVGRILTDHLGELMMYDIAWVGDIVAKIDVRMAAKYPALAVIHPRRNQLRWYFPPNSRLPQFTLRDRRLGRVYAMAFARAAGRIGLAREYKTGIARVDAEEPTTAPIPSGREWLIWFQQGLTSLATGDLQQAADEFRAASGYATTPRRDSLPDSARLTFGYRSLVSALLGATTAARNFHALAHKPSERVGSFGWSLLAASRAIVEVEEDTEDSHDAIAALDLIDDQESLWPYLLLAQTRYAELHGLPADSLALNDYARSHYRPEMGSFAYDVVAARRVETLVILGRLAAARTAYDHDATDGPHCRLAHLGLLLGEHNYVALEREADAALELPTLSPAQRVQAQALCALGVYARDGEVRDFVGPGLGFALSQRRHRRIALMFPPLMREALAPYLLDEAAEDWERSTMTIRLWASDKRAKAPALTPRESALLKYVDQDLSIREIARQEHVSVNTVKTQLKSLYKKLGASTRADAAEIARRWLLLDNEG